MAGQIGQITHGCERGHAANGLNELTNTNHARP